MNKTVICILWLTLLVNLASGQESASNSPKTHMIQGSSLLDVCIAGTKDLVMPLTFTPADITIKYGDNGTVFKVNQFIDVDGLVPLAGDPRTICFRLNLTPEITPSSSQQTYTITVNNLRYSGSPSVSPPITASGTIYSRANITSLVKATQSALAVTKTTQEKDLFAGLNISVPSATAGAVSGDLAYNYSVTSIPKRLQSSALYDSGNVGLHVDKGSSAATDARHFDLGISARKTILLIPKATIATIANGLANAPGASVPTSSVISALNSAQDRFFKAVIVDYGFQMEADVSKSGIGGVSNAVLDVRPQIASGAESFADGKGYFSIRLLPVGTELGHNIAKPTASAGNVGGVVRLKSALDLTLLYKNDAANSFIQMVSLTSTTLYRRLFESETAFDPTTSTTTSTVMGNRFWQQSDLSIFSSKTYGKIRPGVKISYQDGSLPPVFSKVHSFTYGLVFQSVDSSQ